MMRVGGLAVRSLRSIGSEGAFGWPQVAVAVFDPSGKTGHRTIGAHGLGVKLPDNAVVIGGWIEPVTTFTSATDAATIAIHAESANDIKSAVAISDGANPWDSGARKAVIPKINTPESTSIKLSAEREITATVAVEALTAGKARIYVVWVPSE